MSVDLAARTGSPLYAYDDPSTLLPAVESIPVFGATFQAASRLRMACLIYALPAEILRCAKGSGLISVSEVEGLEDKQAQFLTFVRVSLLARTTGSRERFW